MKKNIVVAFFISIFLLVVVLAIFSVFKIKKVAVDFNVAENCVYDTEKIQEKLPENGDFMAFLHRLFPNCFLILTCVKC